MIRKLFLIFVCMLLLCGCAQALSVTNGTTEIRVYGGGATVNLTQISEKLNDASLLRNDDGIWYLNKSIRLYDAGTTCRISSDDVSELRIWDQAPGAIELYSNYWEFENITIGSWNYSSNSYSTSGGSAWFEGSPKILRNVKFDHFGRVFAKQPLATEIYNLTIVDGIDTGLLLEGFNDSVLHDITITNYSVCGLNVQRSFNTEIYNVNVTNIAGDSHPGHFGIVIMEDKPTDTHCNNTYVHDCSVENIGYSGVDTNSNYTTFRNLTIINSTHNGLDIHGGSHHILDNITIIGTKMNNVYALNPYCVYTNIRSINPGGNHFDIKENGSTFTNIYMSGGSIGYNLFGSTDVMIINSTKVNSTGKPAQLSYITSLDLLSPYNTTFIDADFTSGQLFFAGCNLTKLINVKYDSTRGSSIALCGREYAYYADVVVKNSTSYLSATVNFTNEDDAIHITKDGLGHNKSSFETGADGRTELPSGNRLESAVLTARYDDLGVSEIYSHAINVSTDFGNVGLDNINPSQSWYRSNPAASKYTITALINDSANTHITGFAPSVEENTFSAGDEVTYQVWLSEDADSISWEKNGVEVATDTLTYTDTFSTDPVVVSFSATDANGDVSYTWDYNPETLPVAEFSADVTSGTAPLTVQFTDLSENALSWYWDFDNDGTVDSSTQNPEYIYSTAGTYTVNLTVQNGENADSEVKEMYISVDSPSIITSYWNSFWAWWGMRWQITYWLEEAV